MSAGRPCHLRPLFAAALLALCVPSPATAQLVPDPVPAQQAWWRSLPFRFSGQATLTTELYNASGIEARRPGAAWRLNMTPQVALFGDMRMSMDILLSTENVDFRQNINQLGISPSWRWAQVHLGDFSRDYSPYTVQGVRLRGAGLDLEPGLLRISIQGGQAQRRVSGDLGAVAHSRRMLAARAGFGREDGHHFNLTFLSVKDDLREELRLVIADTMMLDTLPADLRPVTDDRPQENLSLGLDAGITAFSRALTLRGSVAASVLTRDLLAAEVDPADLPDTHVPGILRSLHTVRLSTVMDYAWQAEAALVLGGIRLRGGYEHVGPGYNSLGVAYMVNDRQAYNVNAAVRALGGRVSVQGGYRHQHNNLLGQKLHTVDRNTANATLSLRPSASITANLAAVITDARNDAAIDTARLENRAFALTATTGVQTSLLGRAAMLTLGYGFQRATDANIMAAVPAVETQSITTAVQLTLSPAVSVAPSLAAVETQGTGLETQRNVQLGFRGNGRLLDGNLRMSANVAHTISQGRQILITQGRASYPFGWGTDLSLQARMNRYSAFGDRPQFREAFLNMALSRSF